MPDFKHLLEIFRESVVEWQRLASEGSEELKGDVWTLEETLARAAEIDALEKEVEAAEQRWKLAQRRLMLKMGEQFPL